MISDHLLRAELARAQRGDVQDAEQSVQAEQGNAEDGANARLLEDWAHDLMVLEVLVAADTRLILTVRADLTMEVHHETNVKKLAEHSKGFGGIMYIRTTMTLSLIHI